MVSPYVFSFIITPNLISSGYKHAWLPEKRIMAPPLKNASPKKRTSYVPEKKRALVISDVIKMHIITEVTFQKFHELGVLIRRRDKLEELDAVMQRKDGRL